MHAKARLIIVSHQLPTWNCLVNLMCKHVPASGGKSALQADAPGGHIFLENSVLPDGKYCPHQGDMSGSKRKICPGLILLVLHSYKLSYEPASQKLD